MKKLIPLLMLLLLCSMLSATVRATADGPIMPTEPTPQPEQGIAWWILVLVALGAGGIGVAVAVILSKKH